MATDVVIDLGDVAILPGLVNAHTHLEFSSMETPIGDPGMALHDWIGLVQRSRTDAAADPAVAIERGLQECHRSGVRLVGEISTTPWPTLVPAEPMSVEIVSMAEVLGLSLPRQTERLALARRHLETAAIPGRLSPGISPHAPYSTTPQTIEACAALSRDARCPLAMHVAESPHERELLEHGTGPLAEALRQMEVWQDGIFPWGHQPLKRLLRTLATADRTLLVHGNHLDDDEIDFIATQPQMSVVYCPRTHAFFGQPEHPVGRMIQRGARVALGTDSRASNPDLALWNEVVWLGQHRPDLEPIKAIEMATKNGADALGRRDLGRIEPGGRPGLITLPTTANTIDRLCADLIQSTPAWVATD